MSVDRWVRGLAGGVMDKKPEWMKRVEQFDSESIAPTSFSLTCAPVG